MTRDWRPRHLGVVDSFRVPGCVDIETAGILLSDELATETLILRASLSHSTRCLF